MSRLTPIPLTGDCVDRIEVKPRRKAEGKLVWVLFFFMSVSFFGAVRKSYLTRIMILEGPQVI